MYMFVHVMLLLLLYVRRRDSAQLQLYAVICIVQLYIYTT